MAAAAILDISFIAISRTPIIRLRPNLVRRCRFRLRPRKFSPQSHQGRLWHFLCLWPTACHQHFIFTKLSEWNKTTKSRIL